MAVNALFDWRRSDRRLFGLVAILFPLTILIGFGRTYYLKFAMDSQPVPSILVHVHGMLMSAWIVFFAVQVWLIRSKQARIHMKLGILGIAIGIAMVIAGFFTAAAAAKYGTSSAPADIPPLAFMIVPIFDLILFTLFFGAAIFYRKRPAAHKRLMLLTVINFLPPALARFPFAFVPAAGPLFFFGVPTLLAIGFLAYDTWQNGKVNVPYLIGTVILIASYPLRLVLAGTDTWMSFATWLTSWAA